MSYHACVKQVQNISQFDLSNEVSVEELEQGMLNAARLIRRYGAIYWPVVERLQREIDSLEKREALLSSLLDEIPKIVNQANFG